MMTEAIDTHAHIYPAWYLDQLERGGVSPQTTAIARNMHADSTDEDMRLRLQWMDRAGVATQVLAITPQIPSMPEPGASALAAEAINDEYARIRATYPGRFEFYAALPIPHTAASLAELERAMDALGANGVSITTTLPHGPSLADPHFDPLWQALDDRAAVVNIHPTGSGARSEMITSCGLHWVNGAPVEDATAVLQLLKAGVPDRFNRIRFHVAHLGGDLPFLAQRIEDNYEDWNAFPSSPLASMRRMWFDAANFHEPSLRLAAETFGVDQILAGSDHPYFQAEKYVRAFDYIRTAALENEQIDKILSANATTLYGWRN